MKDVRETLVPCQQNQRCTQCHNIEKYSLRCMKDDISLQLCRIKLILQLTKGEVDVFLESLLEGFRLRCPSKCKPSIREGP